MGFVFIYTFHLVVGMLFKYYTWSQWATSSLVDPSPDGEGVGQVKAGISDKQTRNFIPILDFSGNTPPKEPLRNGGIFRLLIQIDMSGGPTP
jgi:hypothetical protein